MIIIIIIEGLLIMMVHALSVFDSRVSQVS